MKCNVFLQCKNEISSYIKKKQSIKKGNFLSEVKNCKSDIWKARWFLVHFSADTTTEVSRRLYFCFLNVDRSTVIKSFK